MYQMSPWKTKIEYIRLSNQYQLTLGGENRHTVIKTLPTELDAQVYQVNVEAPALAHLVARILTVAPDHLPRLLRAAELVKGNNVVHNGVDDTYYVAGSSRYRLYKVHIPADDPDNWTCVVEKDDDKPKEVGHTCPDILSPNAPLTKNGRKRCKHMAAAWMKAHYPALETPDAWQIVANAEYQDKVELRKQIEADRETLEQRLLAAHPMYFLSQQIKAKEAAQQQAARQQTSKAG